MIRPCCLIVEDQALIGLSLEAYLEENGYQVAGPFLTNADALRWLERHTPELALLDVILKDGPCLELARLLKSRGVPFAIYSGLKPQGVPPELEEVPWLQKPVGRADLARVLAELSERIPPGREPETHAMPGC
jgi:two-component SAPR family response regulator